MHSLVLGRARVESWPKRDNGDIIRWVRNHTSVSAVWTPPMQQHFTLNSRITPTRADARVANAVFRRFAKLAGAEHIAGRVALRYLAAVLRIGRPRTVLESGAGIGTITSMLAAADGIERVVAVEDNDFCLGALQCILDADVDSRISIATSPEELINMRFSADLVIADGGWCSKEEFEFIDRGTTVFVEGSRSEYRAALTAHLISREPALSIEFREYGVQHGWILRRTRFGIPRPHRVRRRKGCWIGVAE